MRPEVVFVTAPLPGTALEELAARAEVRIHRGVVPIPRPDLIAGVREADALIVQLTDRIDAALLEAAPRLRVVGTCSAGFDHIAVEECRRRGITITHTPDVLTDATADLAFALLLAVVRRIVEADRLVREGGFQGWRHDLLLGGDLAGRTFGVAGFGRIGRAVARRAVGFGMQVLYLDPRPAAPEVEEALGARRVDRDTILAESDVLSLHLPLTHDTRHFLDAAALGRMKPTAYVINTSRGQVVDEAALAAALAAGRLRGAGLDVFEDEPRIHPGLLALRNVVLAPHIGSATVGTRTAMAAMVARDVARVLEGRPPEHPVP